MIRYEFVTKVYPQITRQGEVYLTLPTQFDQHFNVLWKRWEQKAKELEGPKQMKSFSQTKKAQKLKEKTGQSAAEYSRSSTLQT